MEICSSIEGQQPLSQSNVDEFSARYDYDVDENGIPTIVYNSQPPDSHLYLLPADATEAVSMVHNMGSTSNDLPIRSHNPVLTESAARTPHQSSQPLALSPFSQEVGPSKVALTVPSEAHESEMLYTQSSCMLSPALTPLPSFDQDGSDPLYLSGSENGNSRDWMDCASNSNHSLASTSLEVKIASLIRPAPVPSEAQIGPQPGPSKRSPAKGKRKLPRKEELQRRREINREASAKYRKKQKKQSSDAEIERDRLKKEYEKLEEIRKNRICELKGAVEAVIHAKRL